MAVSRTLTITRVVGFSAAHRYHSAQLSDAENQRVFGKCNRPHGHGHDYRLEVSVRGEVDPVTGMVMNLADLDRILSERVIEVLDHTFLNYDIEHFAEVVPTCENIVLWLADRLAPALAPFAMGLSRLRLYETADLFVEIEVVS